MGLGSPMYDTIGSRMTLEPHYGRHRVLRCVQPVRPCAWKCCVAVAVALLFGSCAERPESVVPGDVATVGAFRSTGARADSVRDGFAAALHQAVQASGDGSESGHMARAHALAREYLIEFDDSLLVRRVSHFTRASPRERADMTEADRLWRAGREAFGREGVPAAMQVWRTSLRHAVAAHDTVMRATLLRAIGAGLYSTGELDSATVYLKAAYDLAVRAEDYRTMGDALGNLASVSMDRGELAAAAEGYRQAAEIRPRSGHTGGQAADENNLGLIAWQLGDLEEARAAFRRALELNRRDGRDRSAAVNLGNLGDLASDAGEYESADESYREALALNAAAGDSAEMAFVLADLGLLSARRGDLAGAMTTLHEALDLHERTGAVAEAIAVRVHLASVQAAAGDLQRAITTLRRAERDAASADPGAALRGTLALTQAEVAIQLGHLADAEQYYALAGQSFTDAVDAAGTAEAELGRAVLRLLREDHEGALELFRTAARRQRGGGDRRAAALTHLHIATVQRELGDTAAARRTLHATLDTLTLLRDAAGQALALGGLAELATERGATLAAEALYRRALAALGGNRLPHIQWRLHAGLGEALRRRGALAAGGEQLREALDGVEQVAGQLRVPERRVGFLSDKWDVYARLVELEMAQGRDAVAFEMSERLRARRLLDGLAGGRIAARTKESAREQDLRRRMNELSSIIAAETDPLQGRRDPGSGTDGLAPAIEALHAAQRAYAGLLLELRETDVTHARRVNAVPAGWEMIARRLPPRTVLLEYLIGDSTLLAFVITRDTVAALDLRVSPRELRHVTDFARMALQRSESDGAVLWRAPLRRLYRDLLEPIEQQGFLRDVRSLVIVPHAELTFLPFGALLHPAGADRFLVERFDIAYAPSATSWLQLGARTPRMDMRRVLALAPHPERLPASLDEVASIRDVFGRNATLRTGAAATERAFRSSLRNYGVLHLATFGVLNRRNPLFSYVEFARAGPDDGQLTVHEVYGLTLTGQLVVLSACQTALAAGAFGDVAVGDDWIGLVQGFLEAGASAVLASQWPVEDRATARLMGAFYRDLGNGHSPAAALAAAQRALLRDPATAHPFYWAGFVLNGVSRN
jgi:CHAT domain-containing protein/tetratricopeptide (TPR) repeat protein